LAYYADPSTDSRQILRDTVETLSTTFYSGETATDADGSVTIGIVDEAGTTVVASATATTSAGSGVYTYSLAAQSNLKKLTATWSGTWGSAMTFDTHHEVLNGTNSDTIRVSKMFPATLLSASINGTALTASQITDTALFDDGTMQRKSDVWTYTNPGNLVLIEYEAGAGTVAPNDIRWAARTLARYHLLEQVSRIPDRAISVQSEFGQIQLAQPGMNRPTPLPDVNVVLNRHRHRGPTAF
jgi:hypothetical protein